MMVYINITPPTKKCNLVGFGAIRTLIMITEDEVMKMQIGLELGRAVGVDQGSDCICQQCRRMQLVWIMPDLTGDTAVIIRLHCIAFVCLAGCSSHPDYAEMLIVE